MPDPFCTDTTISLNKEILVTINVECYFYRFLYLLLEYTFFAVSLMHSYYYYYKIMYLKLTFILAK